MESNFKEILSALSTDQSYEDCLETLVAIRNAVEWPRDLENITQLRSNDYLKILTHYLYLPRTEITHIALSILENCTNHKSFVKFAIDHEDLLSTLAEVFVTHLNIDAIKRSIFVILGNICKHNKTWNELIFEHLPEFTRHALKLLKRVSPDNVCAQHRSSSPDTLIAVLRFLRLLLRVFPSNNRIGLLKKFKVIIQAVGSFFLEMTIGRIKDENIMRQVIKLIYTLTDHVSQLSMEVTEGDSIINACSRMPLFSQRIPRIMRDVLKIDECDQLECRPLVPNICDVIIKIAQEINIEDSTDEYVRFITCLCFMLLDRCSEQQKKFLPHLFKVLKFIKDPSYADMECFILIIMTFNKHCGGDASLLNYDIFQTLVEKLKWISGRKTLAIDLEHRCTKKERRIILGRSYSLTSCNHPDPTFDVKYSHVNDDSMASSINGNEGTVTESDCPCSGKNIIDQMKGALKKEIMDVMHIYFRVHRSMPDIAYEQLVYALLNCSVHFRYTCMYRNSICHLIQFPDHVVNLMRTSVTETVYDMYKRQYDSSCAKCKRIRTASSRILRNFETLMNQLALKPIRNGLVTDDIEQRAKLILSIPYIVIRKIRLAHYMLEFDCLGSLVQLLRDGSPFKKRIIKVLHVLARQRLAMADPTQVNIAESAQVPVETAAAEKRLVTFKLDDGSTIQADRDMLTKKSWYFSALLEGRFRESKAEEVTLHDTPIDLLSFMLQLLEHPEKIKQLVMDHDLDFIFDAFVFIDRHGQSDLRNLLMSCITKYRMNSKTVAAIYRWSIELKLDRLRTEAVTFVLVHSFEENERVVMFDSLLDVGCTEELTGDIKTILEGSLKPYMRDKLDDKKQS